MDTTLILAGDLHSNSTVALCQPIVPLDDGGEYHASKGQRWLWDCWLDLAERTKQLKKKTRIITVLNGDVAEKDQKGRSTQVISRNTANIVSNVIGAIEPLAELSDVLIMTRGTGAHSGLSANIEENIASNFDNILKEQSTGASTWWMIPLVIEGIKLEIAHHTNMGNLPWTEQQAGIALASRTIFECAKNGYDTPDIVVRSHVHRWADSGDAYKKPRALILPCWTLSTEYIHRIKPGALAQIGAAIIHISGGNYEIEKIKYEPEGRKWVKPELTIKKRKAVFA